MQGFSQVNAGNYYPEEIARDIAGAYSRMGMGLAGIENKKEAEEEQKRQQRKALRNMGILIGATALTGGAAALAAPGAAAGSLGAGLSTFGKGALGAFTGAGPVAAGTKGLAGGLSTVAGALGRGVTGSLISNAAMGAMGGGGGAGDAMPQQAIAGAIGSYFQDVQSANKTSRVLEGTLKDPTIREALYPGINQEQADALLKYKGTLGTIEGAQYLQQTLPMLSRTGAGNVEFDRQLQLQRLRSASAMDRIGGGVGGGVDYGSVHRSFFTQ